ncbi:MAG TPA: hypothetical protein VMH27_05240 [Puia sp.]|nr:hypothetical protein [Puia sp.]
MPPRSASGFDLGHAGFCRTTTPVPAGDSLRPYEARVHELAAF